MQSAVLVSSSHEIDLCEEGRALSYNAAGGAAAHHEKGVLAHSIVRPQSPLPKNTS